MIHRRINTNLGSLKKFLQLWDRNLHTIMAGDEQSSRPLQLPRYSSLSSLTINIAEHGREAQCRTEDLLEERRNTTYDVAHDGMTIKSFGSSTIPPTYRTFAPEGQNPDTRSTFRSSISTHPPTYSSMSDSFSAATLKQFQFAIRGGTSGFKGQSYATLKLYTAETRCRKGGKYPTFWNGDNMFGCVDLSLSGPHMIKSVKLVVCPLHLRPSNVPSHSDGRFPFQS